VPFLESPEKPFIELRTAYSVKLVFSYVVNSKVLCRETPLFEDTKRIMSPEVHPKRFGTFDKQAPGPQVRLHLTGPLVITCCLLTEMAILLKDVKIFIINVQYMKAMF